MDLVLGGGDVLDILDILGRCAVLGCIEYWTVGLEVGCVWLISFFNLTVERTQHAVSLLWGDVGLMWYGWLLKVYGEAGV